MTASLRNFVTALLLSIGVLVVWLTVVMFVASLNEFQRSPFEHEEISVGSDGTAYVRRSSHRGYDFLTLAGDIVYNSTDNSNPDLQPSPVPKTTVGMVDNTSKRGRGRIGLSPKAWSWHVKDEAWYFVRRKHDSDPIYLEGFNMNDGRRIGFIGRRGFSVGLPHVSDRFEFDDNDVFVNGRLSTNYANWNAGPAHGTVYRTAFGLHVLSGNAVYHINLHKRTVSKLPTSGTPIFVSTTSQSYDDWSIAVRTDDAIELFDASDALIGTFPIPTEIRDSIQLTLHRVSTNIAIIEASERSRGSRTVELWKATDGASEFLGSFDLKEHLPIYSRLGIVVAVPSLVPMCFTITEIWTSEQYYGPAHTSALRGGIVAGMIAIAVVSVILGLLVFQGERRAGRSGFAWAIFVFLFGLPGLFGYWFHRKWPATITCERCNRKQQSLRRTCVSCGNDLLSIPPLATDVFVVAGTERDDA